MPDLSSAIPIGKAIHKGYSLYKDHKLEKALDEIEKKGTSLEELINSNHRFASFMRFLRAYEICSSQHMYNTLIHYLINGIKSQEIDNQPDIFQSVLSRLGELTETEVMILSKMQNLGMWEGDSAADFQLSGELERWVHKTPGISRDAAQGIICGIQRSGFIQSRHSTWAGNEMTYHLTGLAKYLLDLIHFNIDQ